MEHGLDRGCGPGTGFLRQAAYSGEVVVIHGEHQIEAGEVVQADLTGAAGQIDAAAVGGRLHTSVSGVAHMPASGARGIHHELIA